MKSDPLPSWNDGAAKGNRHLIPQKRHVTCGVASVAFVKTLEGEPFTPFTISPVAVSVYQLGNFGTARKKLKEWTFTP